MVQKILWFWAKTEETIVVALLSLATYLTFQEVVLRYVFNTGWGGSYEITVMSLIWCTFFGVSLGIRENVHIGVDLLVKKFDPRTQRILLVVAMLGGVAFGLVAAVKGYQFSSFIHRSHLLSRDLRIPMEIGYLAVPVGGVLIALRFIERIVYVFQGKSFEVDRMHELSKEDKEKLAFSNSP